MATDPEPIPPAVQALRDALPGIHAWFSAEQLVAAVAGVRAVIEAETADARLTLPPAWTVSAEPSSVAPWDEAEVIMRNWNQQHGRLHPYTCANRDRETHPQRGERDFGLLVATTDGWVCRDCNYTQNWA